MTYIGIDNGISGSVAFVKSNGSYGCFGTPIKSEQNYTKTKANITRIDFMDLVELLVDIIGLEKNTRVFLERPMINPMRWKSSVSAIRALESTIIAFEYIGLSYQYIDSKEWQKELLPAMPTKTKEGEKIPSAIRTKALKDASLDIGKRLFPNVADQFKKDADGMLIAEYCRRFYSK